MDTPTYKVPSTHAATPEVLPSERYAYIHSNAESDLLDHPSFLETPHREPSPPPYVLIHPVNEAFLSGDLPMPHGLSLLPNYRYILRLIGLLGFAISTVLFLRMLPDFLAWLSATTPQTLSLSTAISILAFVVGLPLYIWYTIADRNGEDRDRAKLEATLKERGVICDGSVLHAYLSENEDSWAGKLIYEVTLPSGAVISGKQELQALDAEIAKRLVPKARLKVLCVGDVALCVL